ncbi:MAG: chromosome partitioning protein, ParB family [Parcubacteria group bacterium Gr01-1014_33]|nr:MAG: chromosome partitioning protein, ParB family [Parcubacteria group bacterium Gr01-1014_33]
MSDSLGRGLDSLIPDKRPEDVPGNLNIPPRAAGADEPVLASDNAAAGDLGASTSASARTYADHFVPRRGDSIFWIELEKIEPNPYQPRRVFDENALQDLAGSIREHGVLQPILVTKREIETPIGLEVKYQLIAGERRWRAARLAGLSQVPAVIRRGVPDDKIRLELALIENVQREDLNAIERAKAFKQLIDEFHMVQREVASRIGKSREMVANTLRLLGLPLDIQDALQAGHITEGHARAILMVGDDVEKQKQMYTTVVADRLNVREAENKARQIGGKIFVPRKRPAAVQDPEMKEWQSRLQERFGTRVQLTRMGERGRIVVEFFSEEELRGLLDKLIKEV